MINKELNFSGKIIISKDKSNRKLYKHQKEAIAALNKTITEDIYKALLVIPTGGGKTFTSVYWVMNQMINNNKKVLWIAHRHELLNQTIDTVWRKASYKNIVDNRESFTYRIISGMHDKPVNIKAEDDFIVASKDSLNRGSEYLEKWIKANRNNICIVVDEAHHAIAKTYRNIINLVEKHSTEWIRVLGLTATPTRTAENEQGLLRKVFNNGICYSVDLNRLVTEGILARPVFLQRDTYTGIKKELTSKELDFIRRSGTLPEEIAKEITLNKERNNLIVNEYIKNKEKYGKTLVFAINIDHAIALNALFKEYGIRSEFVVSSLKDINTKAGISNEENALKIKSFKEDKLDVLINVNILTEGTDIPNVQTVFMTRQTTSSILLNQMIGRGLRGVNAGGTEKAYIVSFIDQWKYKINWVSPRDLPIYGEFEMLDKKTERKIYEQKLIDIKLIENFAVEMDKSVAKKDINKNYDEVEALGAYIFTIFNEENDEEKDCQVIVFNHLKYAYEEFIDSLIYIFKKFDVDENSYDDKVEEMFLYVKDKYFSGYNLSIGFYEEEIKEILYYFNMSGNEPEYMEIKPRKVLSEKECIEKPIVVADELKFENLSMSQIRELDIDYWRALRDKVFEKYKGEDGYYYSATKEYRSLSRVFFQIDHIIPLSKGGKTVLDNLQLLTRWENLHKKDMMPIEFLEERLDYAFFQNNDFDKAKELAKDILKEDKDNIFALNILGRLSLMEGKYRGALIYANKVLNIDKENSFAMFTKGYSYYEKGKFDEAIKSLEEGIKYVDDFFAYNQLGKCYSAIKKKDIALGYYYKALEEIEDIEDDEVISELYFNIGDIYFSKRKYDDSRKYLSKVIEIEEENDAAINNIGVCLERIGDLNGALEHYKKAKEINGINRLYSKNIEKLEEKISKNNLVYKD